MTDHSDELPPRGGRGAVADLGGPVYYMDFGGPTDGPRVVLVHGLGGSHLDWCLAAPGLTELARVWAVDLPGFGRSEPCGRSSAVRANAAVLDRFVREVVGAPVVLVGNSMGGMISILVAARSPDAVSGLVLVDPALPPTRPRRIDLAVVLRFALFALPGVASHSIARRRQRLGIRAAVAQNLQWCGLDLDEVPAALLDQSVALLECRRDPVGMDRAFVGAARSLMAVNADPRRYRATMDEIEVPVLLLHGGRDRLVPVDAARDAARRHPRWRTVIWPSAGHVPQMQMPERFSRLLRGWLDTDCAAAQTPTPATEGSVETDH
jgi:pimeloyl-ACP methyl ester carboxylesterase